MNISLNGQHAVVCGASRGIGAAVARALAELGCNVTLMARDPDALEHTRLTLAVKDNQKHTAVVADMMDESGLEAAAATVKMPVNILINNSGGPPPGPILSATQEQFTQAFRQHVLASQQLVQRFLPEMKASGRGRIVNIISTSVRMPIPGLGVSNTIRGAMASWSKTLASEVGPDNVTVNNVLPGYTNTQRLEAIFEGRAKKLNTTVENAITEARAEVPLGRFAEPEEIASAVAFLCSPAAAYISGTSVYVDGGRTNAL